MTPNPQLSAEEHESLIRNYRTLKSAAEEMAGALEKIGKPALGGKMQQQRAREALQSYRAKFPVPTQHD